MDEPPTAPLTALETAEATDRVRLLAQAQVTQRPLPIATLEHLALADPDPQVRQAALGALRGQPDLARAQLERLAQEASTDPDPTVWSTAMELLSHLDALDRPDPGEAGAPEDPDSQAVPANPP